MQIKPDQLLLARAYRWERERGDSVWLTQPMGGGQTRTFTWKQALDESYRMAAYLRSLGHPPGTRIAILAKNSAHFILADLAIWMAGHISVAIYPTLNAETVRYILEHSESKLLFVGKLDTWADMKPGVSDQLPIVAFPLAPPNDYAKWDDVIAKHAPITDRPEPAPDTIAILVYTSGSTGQPKGVVHNFATMAATCVGFEQVIKLTPNDRLLSYLPLAHVFERAAVEASCIYNASQIFFAESLDTFVRDMQRARPTVFHSVPRLWLKFQSGVFAKMPEKKLERLLRIPLLRRLVKKKILKGLGLDAARMAISGSAPIPPELIQWYRRLGVDLLEGYAMTENFAYSHFSQPGRARAGYVGEPGPGVEVRISPEGEVLVKSPGSMVGYYKQPELSKEAFTDDGFLKTGDRGEVDELGRLKITGRVKELFKTSKGKYVAPAPIENMINADSRIEQSCVTGAGEPQPHAVVMLAETIRPTMHEASVRDGVTSALRELLNRINARVDPHEQLQFIAVVKDTWQIENGFLTPTMKIKRGVIEERYASRTEVWTSAKKPVIWES